MGNIGGSYVYECLEENSTCDHPYFTYYSEFRESDIPGIIECIVLFLVFLASVLSNLIVIYHGLTKKTLRTVTNCFILNLAVADVAFSLTIPFVAIIRVTQRWIFGDFLCKAVVCTEFMSSTILIWSLTVIGIDRYRCIVIAPRQSNCNKYHVLLVIIVIWITPMLLYVPFAMNFNAFDSSLTPNGTSSSNYTVCSLTFLKRYDEDHTPRAYAAIIILCNSFIPISILSFTSFKIFKKLKEAPLNRSLQYYSSKLRVCPANFQSVDNIYMSGAQSPLASLNDDNSLKPLQESVSISHLPSSTVSNSETPQRYANGVNRHRNSVPMSFMQRIRQMRHYRSIKLLLITVLVQYVMWLPLRCIAVVMLINTGHDMKKVISSHDVIYCLIIAFANPFANAVLFGILNGNFRPYLTFCRKKTNASST